jgi:hypothetical protein
MSISCEAETDVYKMEQAKKYKPFLDPFRSVR